MSDSNAEGPPPPFVVPRRKLEAALARERKKAQATTAMHEALREVRDWADNWVLIPQDVIDARDWERVMLAVRKAIADYEAVNTGGGNE